MPIRIVYTTFIWIYILLSHVTAMEAATIAAAAETLENSRNRIEWVGSFQIHVVSVRYTHKNTVGTQRVLYMRIQTLNIQYLPNLLCGVILLILLFFFSIYSCCTTSKQTFFEKDETIIWNILDRHYDRKIDHPSLDLISLIDASIREPTNLGTTVSRTPYSYTYTYTNTR